MSKSAVVVAMLLIGAGCGGGGGGKGSCTNACPSSGATQCSGSQVEMCATNANGCLAWGAAIGCLSGQQCDPTVSKCVAICDVKDVHDACTVAAGHLTDCCGGGNSQAFTDSQAAFTMQCNSINATPDQKNTCAEFTTKDCASIHSMLTDPDLSVGGSACCCPSGQFCDPENGNACTPTCSTNADCVSNSTNTACAPVVVNDTVYARVKICKPDDGAAWHGCNGLGVTCGPGYDCFKDANGDANCLRDCTSDAVCASPSVACCNTNVTCNNGFEPCGAGGGCSICQ